MQVGEMDWWELPTVDLLPLLKRTGKIQVEIKDRNGTLGLLKMNNLQPPFDNPAIRRALLGAVVQKDFMTAIAGEDPAMWQSGVGIFTPGTDMASEAGMEVLNSPRDLDKVRAEIRNAGYNNDTTVLLAPSEPHYRKAMGDVAGAMLQSAGLNVEIQSMDWGTAIVRRENKQPVEKGGWSVLCSTANGLDMQTPSLHFLRTTGQSAWFGWTNSPRIEELRAAWVDAPDLTAQKQIAGLAEHNQGNSRWVPVVLGRAASLNALNARKPSLLHDRAFPDTHQDNGGMENGFDCLIVSCKK
jgi:peptide/nickel transport system substrate-binding protein